MVNNTHELLLFLEEHLGESTRVNNTDVSFYCPFCNHHKKKLQIHLGLQHWRCWVCNESGKTFYTLLKKIEAPKESRKQLSLLLKDNDSGVFEADVVHEKVTMPPAYTPLWIPDMKSPDYRNAVRFLLNRGVTVDDIFRYRIGYCTTGEYINRIIIPSYDSRGKLNYFVSRSFYPGGMKYKNPNVSKDIIGFESFINWKLPIVLVEGVFDAIAIRRNAIPLFGTYILDNLRFKILEEDVQTIYVCLDNDAKDKALGIADEFSSAGIDVCYVDLKDKDPSDVGFDRMNKYIRESTPINRSDLFSKQIEDMLGSL